MDIIVGRRQWGMEDGSRMRKDVRERRGFVSYVDRYWR